ncbi:MAG: glycosyltransferase family 2 protein [Chitinophagaceae bacterium]|nr:glycosyltransferase family 2 protein [Chitinophagaceae bacterium]
MNKLAVLITCFNRKEKTIKCLSSLLNIIPNCDVYLVDDASTDGTEEEVKKRFPDVNVLKGDGNLFWNRGMYKAWTYALEGGNYKYYLWLNDDVELYPFFFDELLECNTMKNGNCIISGLVEDKERNIIYGGVDRSKKKLQTAGSPQEIVFMNGNVVLVPDNVVSRIGVLDPTFHHDLGDVDYGLRAIRGGIKVFSTRKAIALGYCNNFCRVRKWEANLSTRMQKLYSPLGSNPNINFYFRKKHFGILNAGFYWVYLHLINLLPDNIITLIFGDRYHDKL